MSSSLRPAWKGGRGFQPPPTVTSDAPAPRGRSSSNASNDGQSKRDSNKFSALQDDDDFISVGSKKPRDRDRNNNDSGGDPKQNSRSEAFRSSFQGRREAKPSGRSLADLAARVPEGVARSASTGYVPEPRASGGPPPSGRRFSDLAGGPGRATVTEEVEGMPKPVSDYKRAVDSAKVIRYTREKLLALRPRPKMDAEFPPPHLKKMDVVLMSEQPQDPGEFYVFFFVCQTFFSFTLVWSSFFLIFLC